jgi:hypothetical protein
MIKVKKYNDVIYTAESRNFKLTFNKVPAL